MKMRTVIITIACAGAIVASGVVSWVLDTHPPFEILSVEPTTARAGEVVMLKAKVRRDIDRRCDVIFSRQIFTPAGFRLDLEGPQIMSADQLERLEARAPGELWVVAQVPGWIGTGRAELVSNLQYSCNPWHRWVRPISVTTTLPFEVIP